MRKNDNVSRELYYSSPSRGSKKIELSSAVIFCIFALAVGVVAGFHFRVYAGFMSNLSGTHATPIDFSSLNEVYGVLEDNFNGEIDRQKVVEEAKRGLVNAAGDPYTAYMTADEYQKFLNELNGNVGSGIGVEMGFRENNIKVMRTTPNNPARRAGMLAGDIIYKVNGEDLSGLDLEQVAMKLRGPAGTTVSVTVLREGEGEKTFTLTRETINDESVYVTYCDRTAIMTISRFDEHTGSLAQKYADEITAHGVDKVILDLRDNGGGYVNSAVDVASLWLAEGQKVTYARSGVSGRHDEEFVVHSPKTVFDGVKTIVLVNGMTASAAEILTGALRDYDKATIVGENTFGKGCMQSLENLPDGGVLRVTIADWYTPKGYNISDGGIAPDVVVTRSYEQINQEIDPQLDKALAL